MPPTPPDYEELEKVLHSEPNRVLNLLPDCTEARSAKRHLDLAYEYAKESRERARRDAKEPPCE